MKEYTITARINRESLFGSLTDNEIAAINTPASIDSFRKHLEMNVGYADIVVIYSESFNDSSKPTTIEANDGSQIPPATEDELLDDFQETAHRIYNDGNFWIAK